MCAWKHLPSAKGQALVRVQGFQKSICILHYSGHVDESTAGIRRQIDRTMNRYREGSMIGAMLHPDFGSCQIPRIAETLFFSNNYIKVYSSPEIVALSRYFLLTTYTKILLMRPTNPYLPWLDPLCCLARARSSREGEATAY